MKMLVTDSVTPAYRRLSTSTRTL